MSNSVRIMLLAFVISFVVIALIFISVNLSKPRLKGWFKIDRGLLNPYSLIFFGLCYAGLLFGFSSLLNILCFNSYEGALIPKEDPIYIESIDLPSKSKFVDSEFILGTGSPGDGKDYYYFYSKDDNGRFKLDRVDVSTVSLEKSDLREPSLVTFTAYTEFIKEPTPLGEMLGCEKETERIYNESFYDVVLFIPEDGVLKDFIE